MTVDLRSRTEDTVTEKRIKSFAALLAERFPELESSEATDKLFRPPAGRGI